MKPHKPIDISIFVQRKAIEKSSEKSIEAVFEASWVQIIGSGLQSLACHISFPRDVF